MRSPREALCEAGGGRLPSHRLKAQIPRRLPTVRLGIFSLGRSGYADVQVPKDPEAPWKPGAPAFVETRRLLVRTFTEADISRAVLRWHSDPEVTRNLWLPNLPPEAYFRGLVQVCDQKALFCFAIVHKRTSRLIGYLKLALDPRTRVLISTTVLGERAFWHAELGLEAAQAAHRLLFETLPVQALEAKVYESHEKIAKVTERHLALGRTLVESYEEHDPNGARPPRRVSLFRIERDAWFERAPAVEARLESLPDVAPQEAWTPGAPLYLETRRLVVRTLTETDLAPHMYAWLDDPTVSGNVWHPNMPRAAYFRGLIQAADGKRHFALGVFHKATAQLIGYIKLQIDEERHVMVPTTVLGERAYWNGELGTEATRAVQRFAFERLGVEHVESRVYAENEKVRARLLRLGYTEAGSYEERLAQAAGAQARRVHVYRMAREEWLSRAPAIDERLAQLPDVDPGAPRG